MKSWIAAALASAQLAGPASAAGLPGASRGEQLFRQRCAACHSVSPGAPKGMGPSLDKVVGRRAAADAGFRYSPALAASGVVWTEETLSTYLTAPGKLVPRTTMSVSVPNPTDRADLIAYLKGRR